MRTRRQQIRVLSETFITDFLRQHVPLDQQRSEWCFAFAEIDLAFLRHYFRKRDEHATTCRVCANDGDCLTVDVLQALCPNPVTGSSMIFHAHILAIGEFDLATNSGTLFPPAFGPFRPPDDA